MTASDDGKARIYNAQDQESSSKRSSTTGPWSQRPFRRTDRLVATGSDDGTAVVWNPATGERVAVLAHERTGHVLGMAP